MTESEGTGTAAADVVLVHGLWYGRVSMQLLARRLTRAGFGCRVFGYSTLRTSLSDSAGALRRFIGRRRHARLHLVGHSLGGLVILRMLADGDDLPPGRIVLLGSPVHGSGVARRAAGIRAFRPLLGRSREALEAGFHQAPAGRETGIIAGTGSVGVGRVLGGLEGPGDGTVSVAETRLDGTGDRLELPVTHTGLLLSPAVARATARFLASGRFPASGR